MNPIAKIRRHVARKLELADSELRPERTLQELGIDSLAALELLSDLEEEFGVRFAADHRGLRTLGDVMVLVERELGSARA